MPPCRRHVETSYFSASERSGIRLPISTACAGARANGAADPKGERQDGACQSQKLLLLAYLHTARFMRTGRLPVLADSRTAVDECHAVLRGESPPTLQ